MSEKKSIPFWRACASYDPRPFSAMSDVEQVEYAQRLADDGYRLAPEERRMMVVSIVNAIRWGLMRDKDYEARRRYQELIRMEKERYEQQRQSEMREIRTPDIVIHL